MALDRLDARQRMDHRADGTADRRIRTRISHQNMGSQADHRPFRPAKGSLESHASFGHRYRTDHVPCWSTASVVALSIAYFETKPATQRCNQLKLIYCRIVVMFSELSRLAYFSKKLESYRKTIFLIFPQFMRPIRSEIKL